MKDFTSGSTTNISGMSSVQAGHQAWREAADVPALTIIYHPNLQRIGERAILSGLELGRELGLSRNEPLFSQISSGQPRGLEDETLSRKPIIISKRSGHFCFNPHKSRTVLAISGRVVEKESTWEEPDSNHGLVLELSGRIVLLLHRVQAGNNPTSQSFGMVGQSDGLNRVRAKINQVADLEIPVLLRGHSGTGKELVAQAIHQSSSRKNQPMVSVNMGGLQPELAAAELFGSEKGAYTGALKSRKGFFREANGGTLFLDEIGEAPPNVQTLLLRVLETREVQPVGSSNAIPVDVRIIAATDANLEAMVDKGAFRSPIIHRLSSFEIQLPALRERPEDIGRLLHHMLIKELTQIGEVHYLDATRKEPWFPAPLVALLTRFSWPGNVRQLGNVVRQLVISNRGRSRFMAEPQITNMLQADLAQIHGEPPEEFKQRGPVDINDQLLIETLREHHWELTPAAKALKISRPTLYKLVTACPGLRLARDLSGDEITASFQEHDGHLGAMVQQLQVSGYALRRRLRDMGLTARDEEAGR